MEPPTGVVPCAVRREAMRRRHGIVTGAGVRNDPVSARRHFVPRRARDDEAEVIERIRYNSEIISAYKHDVCTQQFTASRFFNPLRGEICQLTANDLATERRG